MPGMAPGMAPGGPATFPGAMPMGGTGQTSAVTFRGTRITWFDHASGRLLRAEDSMTADFGGGATGGPGIPGMPGGPGGPGGYTGGISSAVNLDIVTVAR
jgi:hypothetical protein